MSIWRCPHCATPQPEAARCWVCRRSSTSCSTCVQFRRSIATRLGYCGLDRRRRPLRGDELRGCWTAATGGTVDGASTPHPPASARTPVPTRHFIPLEELGTAPGSRDDRERLPDAGGARAGTLPATEMDVAAVISWGDRYTLWGEPER